MAASLYIYRAFYVRALKYDIAGLSFNTRGNPFIVEYVFNASSTYWINFSFLIKLRKLNFLTVKYRVVLDLSFFYISDSNVKDFFVVHWVWGFYGGNVLFRSVFKALLISHNDWMWQWFERFKQLNMKSLNQNFMFTSYIILKNL